MNVIFSLCVLTIATVGYGQEVKRVVSEDMKKEEKGVSEDKRIGEESLQEKEQLMEELGKLMNSNDTTMLKYDNDFKALKGTKLGIIVVPDIPEEIVDLEYQPQNILETKENVTTSTKSITAKQNSTFAKYEVLTTEANFMEETETSTFVSLERQSEEKYNNYLNSELKDFLEITTQLPTIISSENEAPEKVNKTVEVSHITVTKKNFTSKNTFPRFDLEVVKQVYTEDQDNKVKRFLAQEPSLKTFERRTFNSWNLLDLGEKKHESVVKITKEVPYPVPYAVEKKVPFPVKVEVNRPIPIEVPKPYPVTFEKNVFFPIKEYIPAPYPVFRKLPYFIQLSVDKPIPYHIPRPYPVYIEKKMPYPVEKLIPIPINIPVDRPRPVNFPFVKNVYYPIEKKVRYPAPISVEKPVAVPVEKPYPIYIEKIVPTPVKENFPYPIHVQDDKIEDDINQSYLKENIAVESVPDHKIKHIETHANPEFAVNGNGFEPLSDSTNVYDHTSFEEKNDSDKQDLKKGEILRGIMTTQLPMEKETTLAEKNKNKTYHEHFGMRIKSM